MNLNMIIVLLYFLTLLNFIYKPAEKHYERNNEDKVSLNIKCCNGNGEARFLMSWTIKTESKEKIYLENHNNEKEIAFVECELSGSCRHRDKQDGAINITEKISENTIFVNVTFQNFSQKLEGKWVIRQTDPANLSTCSCKIKGRVTENPNIVSNSTITASNNIKFSSSDKSKETGGEHLKIAVIFLSAITVFVIIITFSKMISGYFVQYWNDFKIKRFSISHFRHFVTYLWHLTDIKAQSVENIDIYTLNLARKHSIEDPYCSIDDVDNYSILVDDVNVP